ncbi:MerR family transcriptional regulator [Actinomadura spongiicola]|uniref:MerR family transcriptional regulator n=1 Tax=Actinomadura spongiicola TaxID=2303421 RepID=A0A372GQB6_9ACTN|nr:MerR family transcriptional regulator [Actinomadura spongiicola]
MKIGRAAQVSGASVRALRYYEDEGLITPGRLANGYRDYCPSTIATVLQVRALLEAGLPVRLVREALPQPEAVPGDEFLDDVRRYRDRLDRHIAELAARRAALDAYLREVRDPA